MKISKGADYALLAVGYLASSSNGGQGKLCLLYTSPSPRDATLSRLPSYG